MLQKIKAIIVFEGIDAAGKGGVIRRLSWAMDPRALTVWPIAAPTQEQKEQHYLQRFWNSFPSGGEISVFDRSWYGRVLVERIEKYASKKEWSRGYGEINSMEKMLVDDGVRLIKIFLHISPEEQLRRFQERMERPEKRWKLSFEDFRNRQHHKEYLQAFIQMFEKTSTAHAPWWIVASDHKKWARLRALELIAGELSRGLDLTPPKPIRKKLLIS